MEKLITKSVNDIRIGDIRLKNESSGYSSAIEVQYMPDYPGKFDVTNFYYNISPNHIMSGRFSIGVDNRKPIEEQTISNLILEKDAKEIRLALKEYENNRLKLYETYKYALKTKKTTPLYYIDDKHLNVELKDGDVITCVGHSGELIFLELHDTEYNSNLKELEQDELFYEWLTETDKSYSVYLRGKCFKIGFNEGNLSDISGTLHSFNFKNKEYETYLIEGLTLDWLADRMVNIRKKLYDVVLRVYNKYYEELKQPVIKHSNGKEYLYWETPKDIFDCGEKINRTLK